jgi:hypothetical protein
VHLAKGKGQKDEKGSKMKLHKMTLAVLALLTMVSTAALGGIEYIDFEGLPYTLIGNGGSNIPNPSSVLTNDFMSQGVTFGKPGVSAGVAVIRWFQHPLSGDTVAGLDASGRIPESEKGGVAVGDIYFSFVQPGSSTAGYTNSLSFTIGDTGGDKDRFEIRSYDLTDGLIQTLNISNYSRFLVSINLPQIHRVEIDFLGDFGYSMDDLTFNTPIPEPATLLLLGLGGMALLRKRRA